MVNPALPDHGVVETFSLEMKAVIKNNNSCLISKPDVPLSLMIMKFSIQSSPTINICHEFLNINTFK